MKTVTTLMMTLALATLSAPAFAGAKDLKTFKALQRIGAGTEQFMSQIHLGLDDVTCRLHNESGEVECSMTDLAGDENNPGWSVRREVTGRKAQALLNILAAAGAGMDGAMGSTYISVDAIRCKQSVEDVADGSEADRTACHFELGAYTAADEE